MLQLPKKWIIYIVTFLTYSSIHSVRTSWSTLKPLLQAQPFQFSEKYLGALDMIVLFSLAVCLNIFGNIVQKYPVRKILRIVQLSVAADLILLFTLLYMQIKNQVIYVIFYGLMGVLGCLAWPICLYTLSQYFDSKKCLSLSLWNSVSQFGDCLAFILSWLITKVFKQNASFSLIALAFIIISLFLIDIKYFHENTQINEPNKKQQMDIKSDRSNQKDEQIIGQNCKQQNIAVQLHENHEVVKQSGDSMLKKSIKLQNSQNNKQVNYLNVWLIPGVAWTVLAYSIIKAVNSAVVVWLVLYLVKYQKIQQATVIAIIWPVGIVLGSLVGTKFNSEMSYFKFIIFIGVSSIFFLFLGQMHSKTTHVQIIVILNLCAISLGGPYNQMSTAIPLKLSQQPEVKNRPGAKSSIISLMQGFGQFMCGLSVLIIPLMGVQKINIVCFVMCLLGMSLLAIQQIKKKMKVSKILSQMFKKTPTIQNQPQQLHQVVQEKQ